MIHVVYYMEVIKSGVASVLKGRKKMFFIQFLSGMIYCFIIVLGTSTVIMIKKIPLFDLRIMRKIVIDGGFCVIIKLACRFTLT
mgnify:CR=1 FL=1